MSRLIEILLGLPKGFLGREGDLSIQFNPHWPLQEYVGGAGVWNLLLILGAAWLVIHVYRREGRTKRVRVTLGAIRAAILLLLIILLNNPVLTLSQIRREPSVLAVLVDDSLSMSIKDVTAADGSTLGRLEAVQNLFADNDADLLRKLATVHDIKLYDFSTAPRQIASVNGPGGIGRSSDNSESIASAVTSLQDLKAVGDTTQMVFAVKSVLQDLQGQRVAGVVVLSDGRETPEQSPADAISAVKAFGVNIYPVAVGSERTPRNIAVDSVSFEPSAFVDDITDFRVTIHATGYEPNHQIVVALDRQVMRGNEKVLVPVTDDLGREITRIVEAPDDKPFQTDIQFKPTAGDMPTANLVIVAIPQPGELDESDNYRPVQLAVLDNNISVLYVDGYPRWDYRYIKNSMLRDKTIKISCLLTSADPSFRQEGSDDPNRPNQTWAIDAFPNTMDQLLDYDVVLMGDVDPREFSDAQLQMISDFVSKKGGGFEMVAGPRFSPQLYRNTPIEPVLPVIITHTAVDDSQAAITNGFNLVLTPAGEDSSIFRFFPDNSINDEYIKNHLQALFWYCRGAMVKPGVGIALAEHPNELGPDNRKAPLLVTGRFGAGRTIFSAIDDSWRWRYYTGESIFNTYWVQQIRYLARGRKLGERKLTFTRDQDVYELGKQVTMEVRVLSPELLPQISPPIMVQIVDDATGQVVRRLELNRQEGQEDVFSGSFTADKVGNFSANLPRIDNEDLSATYKVETPSLELVQPQVDAAALSRLATETPIPYSQAASKLPMIHSAARIIPIDSSQPLTGAPLALVVFALLLTVEWVVRKMFGML
ncbi:MAG: VWA domain-containing protein [Tepidisphaeraceae bacterium]|jgi:uncharacterized membrane protein